MSDTTSGTTATGTEARPIISTPVSGAPLPERREGIAAVGSAVAKPAVMAVGAAASYYSDVRSARALTVDARVDRVLAQYEGLSAPLLDMDQTAAIMAMTGFDDLKGSEVRSVRRFKAQWEDRAKSAVEVAAQEAACMGAANGDGILTKENIALLKKRYGGDMQTSKLADSTVGGIGRGAIGAGIGFFGLGIAAFSASMHKGNGFFTSVFVGIGGSIAGLFGGTMLHKGADILKEKLGFGFGLATDNHMSKFENAMKEAAKAGHVVANEYDIEVVKLRKGRAVGAGESRRLSVAEIAERKAEEAAAGTGGVAAGAAGATVAAAAAVSATASSTTTAKSTAPAESVAPEERIVIAKDSVLAALAGRDKEMMALLNGTATEKAFDKMTAKERRALLSDMFRDSDPRAEILSAVDAGRYVEAKAKAEVFAKTLASPAVLTPTPEALTTPAGVVKATVMDDTLKALVDAGVAKETLPKAVQDKITAAIRNGEVHANYDAYAMMGAAAKTASPTPATAALEDKAAAPVISEDDKILRSMGAAGEDTRPDVPRGRKAAAVVDAPSTSIVSDSLSAFPDDIRKVLAGDNHAHKPVSEMSFAELKASVAALKKEGNERAAEALEAIREGVPIPDVLKNIGVVDVHSGHRPVPAAALASELVGAGERAK